MNDLNRRTLFGVTAGVAATAAIAPAIAPAATAAPSAPPSGDRAEESWRKLAKGNRRFAEGRQQHPHESLRWRESLVNGQAPFAAVLGCGDSRVPPELVFDEGLGDLFTVRSAGEVLDTAIIGSIEYAVEHLNVPLVVILGHESCGAVKATIDTVNGNAHLTGDISVLVRSIEPAVRATPVDPDPARHLAACVAEQTRRSAAYLVERSSIIREAVAHHGVKVVPATYELRTGKVTRLG
ncbi:carbonic anhydrase [Actinokineospora guangxiensis]|uniref:Carbonic anhydrase n=1 Tax=Actinokineospora guangxiensis TaxID=1490288 RepID=A0ABW0EMJ5_9PSEU